MSKIEFGRVVLNLSPPCTLAAAGDSNGLTPVPCCLSLLPLAPQLPTPEIPVPAGPSRSACTPHTCPCNACTPVACPTTCSSPTCPPLTCPPQPTSPHGACTPEHLPLYLFPPHFAALTPTGARSSCGHGAHADSGPTQQLLQLQQLQP